MALADRAHTQAQGQLRGHGGCRRGRMAVSFSASTAVSTRKRLPPPPFSPEAQGCRRLREHNQGRVVRGMKDLAALHKTGTVVFIEGGYDSGQRTGLKFLLLNCRHLSSPDHSHQASSY
jgi:hypothetical protein